MRMQNNKFKGRKGKFLFLFFFPLLWLLLGAIVMWLWNAILPSLLHTASISYWQSVGLLLLCRILFGGFHFRKPGDRSKWGDNQWANKWGNMREKWMNMSEEERTKFRGEMRNRCRPSQREGEKKEDKS